MNIKCVTLLLLAIIGMQILAHAQNLFIPDIDSLHQLLEEHPKEDAQRVVLLNEYAQHCFYDLEYIKGFEALIEANKITKTLDYNKGHGLYLHSMTIFHRQSGMAFTYHLKVMDTLNNAPVFDGQQKLSSQINRIIDVGFKDAHLDSVISNLHEAREYFEAQSNTEILTDIHYQLSMINFRASNNKQAFKYWHLALDVYRAREDSFYTIAALLARLRRVNNLEEREQIKEYELEIIELIEKSQNPLFKAHFSNRLAIFYFFFTGQTSLALEYFLKCDNVFDTFDYDELQLVNCNLLAVSYDLLGNPQKAIDYFQKGLGTYQRIVDSYADQAVPVHIQEAVGYLYMNYTSALINLEKFDEANQMMEIGYAHSERFPISEHPGRYHSAKARLLRINEAYDQALQEELLALSSFKDINNATFSCMAAENIAKDHLKDEDLDKALEFALQAYEFSKSSQFIDNRINTTRLIADLYKRQAKQNLSNIYLQKHIEYRDEKERQDNLRQIADAEIKLVLSQQEQELLLLEQERLVQEQETKVQRLWIFSIAGALLSAIVLSIVLYRNNKSKQKANSLLKEQKEEIQSTLEKLESTQSQLIQSEKMASLGELTAGIAHEIQNPLNFVNNFSEVNDELLDDLKEAIAKNDQEEIVAIYNDLKENESKIKHHGRRAEGIVKGMLQHSRTNSREKEPTDINVLADEYLRLAHHGMRAKDKSFNAEFKTDFDPDLPKITVVPQDIGRVLLNLINNAFYAVSQKAARHSDPERNDGEESVNYRPEVIVSTKILPLTPSRGGHLHIQISVKDNGPGIPDDIKDKIFQPFFTTKPTGSGTGLGLSLSYDIITKGHGGSIEVKSPPALPRPQAGGEAGEKGAGTEFLIKLPLP